MRVMYKICAGTLNEQEKNKLKNFRQHLLALIKEAFKKSDNNGIEFYNKWYYSNTKQNNGKESTNINTSGEQSYSTTPKPFTFTYFIEDFENILNVSFIFSTNNYEFLYRLHNGLMTINHKYCLIGNTPIKIIASFLIPPPQLSDNKIIVKTLAPVLVRSLNDGKKYLIPENIVPKEDFNKKFKYIEKCDEQFYLYSLKKSIITAYEKFYTSEKSTENLESLLKVSICRKENIPQAKFVPIYYSSNNKAHPFCMTLPGVKGIFEIEAPSDVLQTIYDIGIGARRSEGFGMVEIKK